MKKVLLLVALFLGGMTTQLTAQHHGNHGGHTTIKKGKKHRYYNSQSVRFVEDGVLFTVYTDGTFDFEEAAICGTPYQYQRQRQRQNRNVVYHGNSNNRRGRRGHINYNRLRVKTDLYGNIIAVNNICIGYKRNGKVKQIGSVPIYHQRGFMVQVGGMTIEYNRFGEIRRTYGTINRFNRNVWHDDWYTYNDYDNDWDDDWNDWDDDVWEGRRIVTK
ncbi:hypothetical protein POV27_07770 [Aureisphaera galaxeae]|uniref:hypothetical protein n=1 Tax=Aureisphaera galaxeae TaxID=1538023 RepID=UPI002350E36A|nr:hypothetical protein [Aureisphaera galaxeae]MDC8003946.1 hypothetical protein [Aureisphaera galaxeae]